MLCGALITACNGQTASTVQNLSAQDYAQKLKAAPQAQLLDVRTPAEFDAGHLDGATNLNWNGPDFEKMAATYDKSKPVFVYCKIGGRSGQAASKLTQMGFTQVYNLDGGILKWDAAGLPLSGDTTSGMKLEEYDKAIASADKVLVNFYAEWCEPCKKMAPYMGLLAQQYKGKVTVLRLDADQNKTLLKQLHFDELPVTILYEKGEVAWERRGFVSEQDLKKELP